MNYDIFQHAELIDTIKQHYDQNHRYYHSWEHITDIFKLVDDLNIQLDINQILALLFHDIIYAPKFSFNEEASASLMMTILGSKYWNLPNYNIQEIYKLIISTKEQNFKKLYNTNSSIIHDLDYFKFGDSYTSFLNMRNNIRKEHADLTDEQFSIGSIVFVENLLNQEHIFCSEQFQRLYEKQAIKNLKKYIQILKST